MHCPGKTVIAGRHHRGISAAAILIGNIRGAVGPNFDVTMEAAAISKRVNRHSGAVSESAVQTDGARSVNHTLRAVINRVLISNRRRQLWNQAGSERPATNCLVVNAGRNAASYSGRIAGSIIISK